jgi:hypothetical protein
MAAKSFDDLEIVLPRPKRPRHQFFSRYVKERFRILDIQITILWDYVGKYLSFFVDFSFFLWGASSGTPV